MEFLSWLETTAIANAIRASIWMYPALESAHYIGLAMLVGSIAIMDLRLLGIAKALPIKPVMALVPFAWTGFAINAVTGSMIFIYNATSFGPDRVFRLKMSLIVLAGINTFIFQIAASRANVQWVATGAVPLSIKSVAAASLLLWIAVVTAGRWMAYV
ncbi:DUF6644 family protein [Candidatus Rariloculus sp.]|uniref:DUF6644 family protein n=1 Tax=Candidatus Rariloculus sp. TaxID=3101265 RepID=UPI003D0DC27F